MIELDERIISGKRPLTPFDEMDSKFIGTDCYFSDDASDFMDVSKNCQKGRLLSIGEVTGLFNATKNNSYTVFTYCLPAEWVKEPEKKWRAYTGIEFAEKFGLWIGHVIRIRDRPENAGQEYEYKIMFVGYRWYKGMFEVFINGCWIDLLTLFELYEYMEDGEWHKFGVEE